MPTASDAGLAAVLARMGRRPMPTGTDRLGVAATSSPPGGGIVATTAVGAAAPTLNGAPGVVLEVQDVSKAVRILRVGRPPGLDFKAGQYVRVGVPGSPARKFTIASAPHEPFLEFCVQLIDGGQTTPRLFSVRPGAQLEIGTTVKGSFLLDEGAAVHLMVGTVTGIAPLRSIVRDAQERGIDGEFIVLHGASYVDELPYREEFTELAASRARVRYHATVSRPVEARNRGWMGNTGRVDPLASQVAETLQASRTTVYACGNSGMTTNVANALGARGFRVITEAFD